MRRPRANVWHRQLQQCFQCDSIMIANDRVSARAGVCVHTHVLALLIH